MSVPRVLPVGDAALDRRARRRARRRDERARARARPRARASAVRGLPSRRCPRYRSLLVALRPGGAPGRRPWARARLRLARPRGLVPPSPAGSTRCRTLYGGEARARPRPLARARGLSERELVRLHASGEYTAFMLGFTPGFAYLGLLPEPSSPRATRRRACASRRDRWRRGAADRHLPRRLARRLAAHRPDVARASSTPSARSPPSSRPGDRVRFVPGRRAARPESRPRPPHAPGSPVVEVLEPGLLTTVQDAGRSGRRRLGVSGAGPLDARPTPPPTARSATRRAPRRSSARCRAGARVPGAACASPWPGPTWARCSSAPTSARGRSRSGRASSRAPATCCASRAGAPAAAPTSRSRAGSTFPSSSARARPTCSRASAASRAARCAAGDRLGVPRGGRARPGTPVESAAGRTRRPRPSASCSARRRTHFDAGDDRALPRREPLARERHLRPGRLPPRGRAAAPRRGPSEILSDGMVPGSIQVPPDGQPIVMTADGPDDRRLPEDRDRPHRRPAAPRPARAGRRHRPLRGRARRGPVGNPGGPGGRSPPAQRRRQQAWTSLPSSEPSLLESSRQPAPAVPPSSSPRS